MAINKVYLCYPFFDSNYDLRYFEIDDIGLKKAYWDFIQKLPNKYCDDNLTANIRKGNVINGINLIVPKCLKYCTVEKNFLKINDVKLIENEWPDFMALFSGKKSRRPHDPFIKDSINLDPKKPTNLKKCSSCFCTKKRRKCTKDCNKCIAIPGDRPYPKSHFSTKAFFFYLIYTIYDYLVKESRPYDRLKLMVVIPVPSEIWMEFRDNFIILANFHLTQIDNHVGNNKEGIYRKVDFFFHPYNITEEGLIFDASVTDEKGRGYKAAYGERLKNEEPAKIAT
ncbi:MAG: hypothetical protein LBD23_18835 [Oscillospiraceae bacterium]|jgi:hypothetical protein|nr:hypothetical protein [Oscillospiraceae bacterium]